MKPVSKLDKTSVPRLRARAIFYESLPLNRCVRGLFSAKPHKDKNQNQNCIHFMVLIGRHRTRNGHAGGKLELELASCPTRTHC